MKNVSVWLLKRPGSDIVILSANTENHFNNCVRGGVPEWSRMVWWRLLDWRKRTLMDSLDLRVIIKMTKIGAIPWLSEVAPPSDTLLRTISITLWFDWWPPLIMGVLFEVGGSCGYALPPVRACIGRILPWVFLVCLVILSWSSPLRFWFSVVVSRRIPIRRRTGVLYANCTATV